MAEASNGRPTMFSTQLKFEENIFNESGVIWPLNDLCAFKNIMSNEACH